tara:strand:- start:164 stop:682 length:519 start_codon:yes stop_codon:yes gene_type:complete
LKRTQYLQRIGIDIWVSRSTSPLPIPVESRFYFLFLEYQSVGVCCSISPHEQALPPDVRRFCDDVAYAISHYRELLTVGELRWPNPKMGGSGNAVFREFVQSLPETIIVFGEKFAKYLLDVEDVSGGGIYKQREQRIFVVDDVSSYIGNASVKKSLWTNIKEADLIDGNSRT